MRKKEREYNRIGVMQTLVYINDVEMKIRLRQTAHLVEASPWPIQISIILGTSSLEIMKWWNWSTINLS